MNNIFWYYKKLACFHLNAWCRCMFVEAECFRK